MQLIDTLSSDPSWVLARFSGDNVLRDGRSYNNEYNNLIRVRDGKIIEWVEVMNPLIWLKTFGT